MTYDNFSETFAKSRQNLHWPELEYLVSNFKPGLEPGLEIPNPRILDIGCGSGRLIPYLEKAYGKFDYLGIDSSHGMVLEAQKEHPEHEFKVIDMTDLDKLSTKFDMIFLIASFHHLETEASRILTLQKLRRILSEDGIACMTNWNLLGERNFRRYEKMYEGNGDFKIKIGRHSRYYHSFLIDELESLFMRTGFDILENKVFGTGNNMISVLTKK